MNNTENQKKGLNGQSGLSPLLIIAAIAAITGLSALTALGFGGLPCFSISGVILAFLICNQKNPLPAISLLTSFIVAFIISGDVLTGVAVLLFVPVGLALAYTAASKRSLSVTVVTVTAVLLISMGAYLTLSLTDIYGKDIQESFKAFGGDIKEAVYEIFRLFRYTDPTGEEIFALSEEDIGKLFDTFVMLLPASCCITCQLIAYGAARLLQLLCSAMGPRSLYIGRRYCITLSAPAAGIFVVSYLVSFFAKEASVVSYAALNLTYILLPLCAVAGFHSLFAKDGIIRGALPKRTKIIFMVTGAVCIFLSPFSAIPLLAVFGSFGALGRAIGAYIKAHIEKNGNSD